MDTTWISIIKMYFKMIVKCRAFFFLCEWKYFGTNIQYISPSLLLFCFRTYQNSSLSWHKWFLLWSFCFQDYSSFFHFQREKNRRELLEFLNAAVWYIIRCAMKKLLIAMVWISLTHYPLHFLSDHLQIQFFYLQFIYHWLGGKLWYLQHSCVGDTI